MPKEAIQTKTGKAFEYALLNAFLERVSQISYLSVLKNSSYLTAKRCYESFNKTDQRAYNLNANSAINFIIDLEPKLLNNINLDDHLALEIASDKQGQTGDVRDVLAIRSSQNWEIGISAKNNHRAVKHSRLSNDIDFGTKWLGFACSADYFSDIKIIFDNLSNLKKTSKSTQKWSSLGDYHTSIYVPILNAFRKELLRLDKENPQIVAQNLVQYLIGNRDFYKVIKGKDKVEIQVYNLHGTLNQAFNKIKPKITVPKLKLPTRLIEVVYQNNSKTTLIVSLSEGWQISFRIHNASSRIEPSLKFDINLISVPQTLFTNHIHLGID